MNWIVLRKIIEMEQMGFMKQNVKLRYKYFTDHPFWNNDVNLLHGKLDVLDAAFNQRDNVLQLIGPA